MNLDAKCTPLLEARALEVRFRARLLRGKVGPREAVRGVDLGIARGEIFGLAGESGSGKSTLARALLGLLPASGGEVLLEGHDIAGMRGAALREFRRRVQMIFQDPGSALSPRRTILQTLCEPLRLFRAGAAEEHVSLARAALADVGMDVDALARYPHQFSSGQRQRIVIARALLAGPDLLVADEAVSALDVSVQAQVLQLLARLRIDRGLAILLISHDLAVLRQLSDRVGVMYAGRLVEAGPADAVYTLPRHPATRELLAAASGALATDSWRLNMLGAEPGTGCPYRARCPVAIDVCREQAPGNLAVNGSPAHRVECHLENSSPQAPDERH